MENYSSVTRFCLICNYVSRIIEPLASRCAKFRFRSVEVGKLQEKLQDISVKEGIPNMTQEVFDTLAQVRDQVLNS